MKLKRKKQNEAMLIDHLLSDQEIYDPGHILEKVQELARKAVVVRADNVARYYFQESSQEVWDVREDFPSIVPPFPITWIEWNVPTWTNSEGTRVDIPAGNASGVLIVAEEIDDIGQMAKAAKDQAERELDENELQWGYINGLRAYLQIMPDEVRQGAGAELFARFEAFEKYLGDLAKRYPSKSYTELLLVADPELIAAWADIGKGVTGQALQGMPLDRDRSHDPRWNIVCYVVLRGPASYTPRLMCLPLSYSFYLSREGEVMSLRTGSDCAHVQVYDPQFRKSELKDVHMVTLHVPFLAFSFFHCKNVAVADHIRGNAPVIKHSKIPVWKRTYKTLSIHPMKKILTDAIETSGDPQAKALHICRGHFKDYRQSGLFGKHRGLFWWDMYARGERSLGEVIKDYEVQAH